MNRNNNILILGRGSRSRNLVTNDVIFMLSGNVFAIRNSSGFFALCFWFHCHHFPTKKNETEMKKIYKIIYKIILQQQAISIQRIQRIVNRILLRDFLCCHHNAITILSFLLRFLSIHLLFSTFIMYVNNDEYYWYLLDLNLVERALFLFMGK